MKLDNRGFAISSIMYIILVLAVILIALTLAVFSSRKLILDKQKNDALHEIYQTRYENGDVVYFDVSKGVGCSEEEYKASYDTTTLDYLNSLTGYNGITTTSELQNSCLKFYAFNDNGGDVVKLLLDHNTTSYLPWNSNCYNSSTSTGNCNITGPETSLIKLKEDTESWKGTITPNNYTLTQESAGYTIDYSNFKARFITVNEIAQITGNTTWKEETATKGFYFDSLTETESDTCKSGNITGCKYGWLYDRLYNCTTYGCLNIINSTSSIVGYLTSTSVFGSTTTSWGVFYTGKIESHPAWTIMGYGIRPVIEVLRENLL